MSTRPNRDPVSPDPPTPPTPVSPLITYTVSTVAAAAALLLGQGLIDNHVEKLVEGGAAILLPFGWVIANAMHHMASARVRAANVIATGSATGVTSERRRP